MNNFRWKVVLCVIALSVVSCILASASPSAKCLQCICHASSGCKPNIRCHNSGNGQYYCGPYQISWAYWADGGKPGYTGLSNDFENCLVDKNCAEAAVRGYMAKWGTDCNGDGQVDCADYAAIHKAGATGCNQPWLLGSKYWSEFNQCYSTSASNSAPAAPPAISPSLTAISNPNTIIEIPQPHPPRPVLSHTSAISSSSSSTAFGPVPSVNSPPLVSSSSFSSSSFSRHNFSHSEVEISETENASSDDFSDSGNGPQPIPNFIANPLPPANFKPLTRPQTVVPSYPQPVAVFSNPQPIPQPSPPRPEVVVPNTFSNVKPPANFNPIVPADCLECLCQASSKCDLNKGCDGAYCGPFLLSWGYWADGGQPGNGLDYPTCAKNRTCAELAVQGYMNKWNKDCNHDGIVDCTDYALIHKLGPHGCGRVEAIQPTDYWKQFTTCQNYAEPSERNPNERSISTADSGNSLSDSVVPLKPEIIETEEQPTLVEQPLPRLPAPVINSFPANPIATPPDASSVRISFNNREVVNTNLPNSRVPPATLHHRPLPGFAPSVPVPPPAQPTPPNNELNQPNNNLNVISNSPLRPTFSNQPPYSSIVSPVTTPPANNPPVEVSFETASNKPLHRSDSSNDRTTSSFNDDYYSNPRAAEQPSTLSEAPLLPASDSSESPSQPRWSEPSEVNIPSNRSPKPLNNTTGSNGVIASECIECICHASSRCNLQLGCKNDGAGKYICGPFQVDWEYWNEAGKPGNRADLSNLENLQSCLTNRQCADDTVRGYMQKWRKDCNEDGAIDCTDFAALHIAGPNSCNAQWFLESQYYADFRSCYDFRRR